MNLEALVKHMKGFALSKVLMTAFDIDLFRTLDERRLSRNALVQELRLAKSDITDAFVDTLIAFGLLVGDEDELSLSHEWRTVAPVYESLKGWNREMDLFYNSLVDLKEVLVTGRV